jgi:DNA helicase II / ATP-dependent DNA helicase PcrA
VVQVQTAVPALAGGEGAARVTHLMVPAASEAVRAALKGFEPTPEQWRAITHPLEPLYLVAGAGSGKTAVMAARIVWVIERGTPASQVLGLTFTNKASEELAERVRTAMTVRTRSGEETGGLFNADVLVQTYNAFAAGIVRDHGLLVGVEPEAGLLSEAQQWQLVMSCFDDLPAFDAIELRSPASLVKSTLGLAGSIADHMVGVTDVEAAAERVLASADPIDSDVRETAAKRKELCRVVEAYQRAKSRASRIDFGDQVMKAVEILEGHSDVRALYRERFPVVLLDEYQDTNVAQRRLIQALVGPGGGITAVGDARQAIYAFRGATMYNLIGFPTDFPRTSGEPYGETSLSENFRSGSNILEVANRVVEGIAPERRPGDPLKPHAANDTGQVTAGLFQDERAEAAWIASECERLHDHPLGPGREPVRWRDIAILVRRKATMDAILEMLEAGNIPVEVVGLGGLLKTPEVTEIVASLRCLDSRPAANRWLARILLGPRWRIHYRDLALCAHWAATQNHDLRLRLAGGDQELALDMEPGDVGFSLLESISHVESIEGLGDDARARLTAFGERLAALQRKSGAPLLELLQEVIGTSGVGDALESSPSRTAPAAKQNVANFLDQVAAFAPVEGEATLRSFLAYLDAAESAEETLEASQPAEQDSVKLMTVHAAKGLEFECVFVPSVASGRNSKGEYVYSIFPNTRSSNPLTSYTELPYEVREDSSHLPKWTGKLKDFAIEITERALEDERRLFYVALTRAKQYLAVSASWWYGRDRKARGPSQFWDEVASLEDAGLVRVVVRTEEPETNPLFESLEERRTWPPAPRSGTDDALFPEGWGAAADAVFEGELSFDEVLKRIDVGDHERVRALIADHSESLEMIAAAHSAQPDTEPQIPGILSATSAARLAAGEMNPWDLVRPLPERPSVARRMGTEIHRLIEEQSRGVAAYPEEGELDEHAAPSDSEGIAHLFDRYRELGYADRRVASMPSGEPMVELPFAMRWDGRVVRGRIDAVFETDDGGLEIVDYKTGRRFEPADADQLDIYAHALRANGLIPDGTQVTLTYAFLDAGEVVSRRWSPEEGLGR